MDKYFGKETLYAIKNFQNSDYKLPIEQLKALINIKKSAAIATRQLRVVESEKTESIIKSADRLLSISNLHKWFPLDVFQTGSGTSSNMNANELIANISKIDYSVDVHPNDHVNWGQSSNCVMPTTLNISNRVLLTPFIDSLKTLKMSFDKLSREHMRTIKIGRTHLQDAVPMTFGQEISGYSYIINQHIKRLEAIKPELEELPIGGTAIGTGVASSKEFSKIVCDELSKTYGIPFKPMGNKFAGIGSRDVQMALMNHLSTIASSLLKITNDFRLLASGPNTGFGEITFKPLQAGSSIMPGKVNPVIAEAMIQVCAFVIGKATSVVIAGQNGPLQLNMMIPLLGHETNESLSIFTNMINSFSESIRTLTINDDEMRAYVEQSPSIITPLKNDPEVGYEKAAMWVKDATANKIPIKQYLIKNNLLSQSKIDDLFNTDRLVKELNHE